MAIKDDPILKTFRAELDKVYGDRLDRVVLFGSRARGDARPDSDYDIAVFLRNPESFWDESKKLVDIELGLMEEGRAVIHAIPFDVAASGRRTLLMHDIRQEGVEL